ncbi:MAG: glycosyltransferase family 2 protein [Patescibacteria group bacterium]|nr:glycosyltransferase family 2 protein [Patescibacteria group bacterium]MDE1988825.1 glycosyltransferase family 2 protein [Patescibacteria group bacterium]MDE2218067.1 glycosyltransferase family 2 protein [Patescibacteria group bacterium]
MKPLISLVTPLFNEEENVNEFYERAKKILEKIGTHEIIFVNDGSRDKTLEKTLEIADKDKSVKIIDFSRNFGHQTAITAGMDNSQGEAVVIMDGDLQDTPETIPELVKKWKEGYEVVYAKRRSRKDTLFKRVTAYIFYRTIKKVAQIDITEDTGDFCLLDRKIIGTLKGIREHSRFVRGLTSWVGFKKAVVLFNREERKRGNTNYSLRKMMKFAYDGITSFSYFPLKMATYLGALSAFLGFLWGIYAIYQRIYHSETTVPGWATLAVAVFFLGGIQLIVLGIIGEYIGRIYTEVQNRPLYIIRQKINFD